MGMYDKNTAEEMAEYIAAGRLPEDGRPEPTTCGECGRTWDDARMTSVTPAPGARCPFEYFHGTPESEEERLEYLRGQINAECISYSELAELQDLADFIQPGDVQLAEWAGIPEDRFMQR